MGDGVLIKYTELKAVGDHLKNIIEELKEASKRSNGLEAAIGNPFGRTKLREAAQEFEDGWDDRRKALLEDIEKVEQHVVGVLEGFEEWDKDTSKEMESASE
ncbi:MULTISPECIES: hypothetical protein [unclassified Salinibacterium]|uniref:hypothetical protein n=1 Tax=unclassified Salinibacterium TaxID=2632331 RepID=UPI0018CEBE17|nr:MULTISPECIES: hypothetical protein [unclassified Salinibacterium]MBH0008877.1 hypothetical protein [Salinibacterium sp. SWN1162]MBH0082969.1 hypothetical protein [Salinibacterium sp. SWN167]